MVLSPCVQTPVLGNSLTKKATWHMLQKSKVWCLNQSQGKVPHLTLLCEGNLLLMTPVVNTQKLPAVPCDR